MFPAFTQLRSCLARLSQIRQYANVARQGFSGQKHPASICTVIKSPWGCDFVVCNLDLAREPCTPDLCHAKDMFCKDHVEHNMPRVHWESLSHECDSCLSHIDGSSYLFCQKQRAETYSNLETCSINSGMESEGDFEDVSLRLIFNNEWGANDL